jgi:hypothetical protein
MRIRSVFMLVTFFIMASAAPADACSCARNPTAEALLQDYAVVFTGVVRGTTTVSSGRSVTTFEVTESFKGTAQGQTVRVRHRSGSSASCGIKFTAGATYTLAAFTGDGGVLSANLCSAWMFQPQVGLGDQLIERMRTLRAR